MVLTKPHEVPPSPIRFDDLEFDLTITTTNAHTGDSIVLNRQESPGEFVYKAVRASASIQYVFREVELQVKDNKGNKLVPCWDGGTTGNCRFDLAQRLYPGRPTIASTLTYRGETKETRRPGFWRSLARPIAVLNHSTSILMRSIEEMVWDATSANRQLSRVIRVEPRLTGATENPVGTYDFHIDERARRTLVENGRQATREALRKLSDVVEPKP